MKSDHEKSNESSLAFFGSKMTNLKNESEPNTNCCVFSQKKKINKIIKLKSPVEKRNEHDSIEKVYDDYL